jgi:serine/threonine protein kinase
MREGEDFSLGSLPLTLLSPAETEVDVSFLGPAEGPGELARLAHYRILKLLGKGGMGRVFLAEDVRLERRVALKVMEPDVARRPQARERFLREARAMAKLKHDHIVAIYDVGTDRDVAFLAMEFLEGESLDRWLQRGGVPAIAEAVRIVREVALGLAAAHDAGLIHRDVKPGNIWLEARPGTPAAGGRVKLLDFGLARSADEDVHLTRSGMVVGTPSYMSPEQARGEALDARSDLFSLGVLLFRLCAGREPFRGMTTMAILTALATEEAPPVRELNPAVPPALADLTRRLLAKKPAERPSSARAVVEALQELDRPLSAAPPPRPAVGPRKPARVPPPKEPAAEPTAALSRTVVLSTATPKKSRAAAWAVSIASMLAGATVVGLTAFVLFGPGLRKGQPPGESGERGTLLIDCDDDEIEAILEGNGAEVLLRELRSTPARERSLEPGSYRIRVRRPRTGVQPEPEQFTIRAGEPTVVFIHRAPPGQTNREGGGTK